MIEMPSVAHFAQALVFSLAGAVAELFFIGSCEIEFYAGE